MYIKFAILPIFKCAVQGHEVHSHCGATSHPIPEFFHLPKLELCAPNMLLTRSPGDSICTKKYKKQWPRGPRQ